MMTFGGWTLAVLLVTTASLASPAAGAQSGQCPWGSVLPAYAHNDYDNRRPLEALHLKPLRSIHQRCGAVGRQRGPFARYPDLIGTTDPVATVPPIEIVLVGWHPEVGDPAPARGLSVGLQYQVTTLSSGSTFPSTTALRLVSLNYGETIGWSGRGAPLQGPRAGSPGSGR